MVLAAIHRVRVLPPFMGAEKRSSRLRPTPTFALPRCLQGRVDFNPSFIIPSSLLFRPGLSPWSCRPHVSSRITCACRSTTDARPPRNLSGGPERHRVFAQAFELHAQLAAR